MQIFLPYKSPYKVAECLDNRRLHKQIIEADWILKALIGDSVSKHITKHPIVLMYKGHEDFIELYRDTLKAYREKLYVQASELSYKALKVIPEFITEDYVEHFKEILYLKDPEYYSSKGFKRDNAVYYNMYYVEGAWRYYLKGKQVNKEDLELC